MLHYTHIDSWWNFAGLSTQRQELRWFPFCGILGRCCGSRFFRNQCPVLNQCVIRSQSETTTLSISLVYRFQLDEIWLSVHSDCDLLFRKGFEIDFVMNWSVENVFARWRKHWSKWRCLKNENDNGRKRRGLTTIHRPMWTPTFVLSIRNCTNCRYSRSGTAWWLQRLSEGERCMQP